MHERLESLVGAVSAIIDALDAAGFDYAFGGAVALSAWAEPRATTDVDLNLWISEEQLPAALGALRAAGVTLDEDAARAGWTERGMFVGNHGPYRVDVFVPSIPFYDEAQARKRPVRLAGRDTWVLSAECLAVFKLLFFRPKDIVDVSRMLELAPDDFDHAFVHDSLVDIVGEDDERIAKWDALHAG